MHFTATCISVHCCKKVKIALYVLVDLPIYISLKFLRMN